MSLMDDFDALESRVEKDIGNMEKKLQRAVAALDRRLHNNTQQISIIRLEQNKKKETFEKQMRTLIHELDKRVSEKISEMNHQIDRIAKMIESGDIIAKR
jgi:Skp family chaperone for outer membrane proteins